MGYNVIVVGATGQVGRQLIRELEERVFPVKKLLVFASEESVGDVIGFLDEEILLQKLDGTAFSGADLVFFCTPAHISSAYMQAAVDAGAFCIDLSGCVHEHIKSPPAVADISPAAWLKQFSAVISPSPSAIQTALLLHALDLKCVVQSVTLNVFRCAAALGGDAVDTLRKQSANLLNGRPIGKEDVLPAFPRQLAYNFSLLGSGSSGCLDSAIVARHVREVIGRQDLVLDIAQFMVPVFYGDALSLHCVVEEQVDQVTVEGLLRLQNGIELLEEVSPDELDTCAAAESDDIGVVVSRVYDKRISLWSTIDNLRKGSALNAVQLAEQRFDIAQELEG